MNEDAAQDLIEIGVSLGMVTVIGILLDGAGFDENMLHKLSDYCAKRVAEMTDTPAEDFMLKVQPMIDKIIKDAQTRKG